MAITQPYISAHVGNASFPVLYVSALVLSNTLFGTFIRATLYINFGSLVLNVLLLCLLFVIGVIIILIFC